VKGKQWTRGEEQALLTLAKAGKPLGVIAKTMGKTEDAVSMKMKHLGLVVVEENDRNSASTTTEVLPKGLINVEDTLKILAGAMEVERLHTLAAIARIYKDMLADYLDYSARRVFLRYSLKDFAASCIN